MAHVDEVASAHHSRMSPPRSRKQHQKKTKELEHGRQNTNHKRFPRYIFLVTGIAIFLLIVSSIFLFPKSDETETLQKVEQNSLGRGQHVAIALPVKELQVLTKSVNITKLWNKLKPMLIPRRPGTKNIKLVRNHISKTLEDLKGWYLEYDTFYDSTPRGRVEFSNIIASTNPKASRKLVLACHYDSKDMRNDGYEFIGATDSAVPCAIMLEIARALDVLLKEHATKQRANDSSAPDVSLDLIFFDGEEAYAQWTATDSIYGARHLAKKWMNYNGKNVLNDIDLLVLLDLIGHEKTGFVNFSAHPSKWWTYAQSLEKRLKKEKLLSHKRDVFYHHGRYEHHTVEDDHIPFLKAEVPILHLISIPFPKVWHTEEDNTKALNPTRIEVVTKILAAFVAEYLHLRLPPK